MSTRLQVASTMLPRLRQQLQSPVPLQTTSAPSVHPMVSRARTRRPAHHASLSLSHIHTHTFSLSLSLSRALSRRFVLSLNLRPVLVCPVTESKACAVTTSVSKVSGWAKQRLQASSNGASRAGGSWERGAHGGRDLYCNPSTPLERAYVTKVTLVDLGVL